MSLANWDGLAPEAGTKGPDRDDHVLAPDAHLEDNPLGDEPPRDTATNDPAPDTEDGDVR